MLSEDKVHTTLQYPDFNVSCQKSLQGTVVHIMHMALLQYMNHMI